MEPICLGAIALLLVGGSVAGVLALVKLGVIARYALKKEPPEQGDYGLDQSQEVDEGSVTLPNDSS